jgi:molybdopterin-containing oxidoreductase family iron-sulfur binding subunit
MEKCTYCVQRINHARIDLKKLELERSLAATPEEQARLRRSMDERMGKLEPACAQTCPTRAIVFGDLNWKFQTGGGPEESPVKKLQDQPQDFALLPELNTRPRTRYLPRFLNPNPEIGGAGGRGSPGKPGTGESH